MMCMQSYCKGVPKAELHVHIEGTLEPELMFTLAQKNNIEIPYNSVDEVKQSYKFDDLQSFLDIYYRGVAVLVTEDDFYQLMKDYLVRAIEDNVKRAEIFFDPQSHTERGVSFETVVKGFHRAIDEVKPQISCSLIMCFLRHLGGDEAVKLMQEAIPHKQYFDAVGLDSSEVGFPPSLFVDAYDLAREHGLRLVAHAGEEGDVCYIREALDLLHVERIDHGVQCTADESLVAELAERRIPLTMCPLSNVCLKVYNDLSEHPAKTLLDKGVCVTINSDDPSYFGGYVAENYYQLATALDLSYDDIYKFAHNSFEACFISESERQKYYTILHDFDAGFKK